MARKKSSHGIIGGTAPDTGLLKQLERAAGKTLSQKELTEQRLSFISGALPGDKKMTRNQISKVLNRIDGTKVA